MQLKDFVRQVMAQRGLSSVRDFARATGLSHNTAWNILRGVTNLDLDTFAAVSRWSGASLPYILELAGYRMEKNLRIESWLGLVAASYPDVYDLMDRMASAHMEGKLSVEQVRAAFLFAKMMIQEAVERSGG